MKLRFLTILILLLAAFAAGQERLNSLAIDGVLSDEAGPYYFGSAPDETQPFARAGVLAKTLGLSLNWNDANRTLSFRSGNTTVITSASSDIAAGLAARQGGMTVNGVPVEAPQALLVD